MAPAQARRTSNCLVVGGASFNEWDRSYRLLMPHSITTANSMRFKSRTAGIRLRLLQHFEKGCGDGMTGLALASYGHRVTLNGYGRLARAARADARIRTGQCLRTATGSIGVL